MRNRSAVASINKPVILLMAIIIVLFILAVAYVFRSSNKSISVKELPYQELAVKTSNNFVQTADVYEKDTDGDGLADWEEVLWSTDPNKADTDGDGVLDKDEVYGEAKAQELAYEDSALNKNDDTLNTTEKVARELMTTYMYSLYEGTEYTEKDTEVLAQKTLQSMEPMMRAPKYTVDSSLIVEPTPENRFVFINKIHTIVTQITSNVTSEHEAIYAIGNGDQVWAKNELQKTVLQYQKYASELDTVPVPSDAVTVYTKMMQALHFYIYTLEGFSVFDTDPMRAAASAKIFLNTQSTLKQSYVGMRIYMDTHSTN